MWLLEAPEKNVFLVSSNLLTTFKVLIPRSRSTAHHLQSLLLPQPAPSSDLSLPSCDNTYTLYETLPDDPGDSPYHKTLHLVMYPESSYPFWAREYDIHFFGRCWSASHTIETLWNRCLSPVFFSWRPWDPECSLTHLCWVTSFIHPTDIYWMLSVRQLMPETE